MTKKNRPPFRWLLASIIFIFYTALCIGQIPNSISETRLERFNQSFEYRKMLEMDSAVAVWEGVIQSRKPGEVDSVLMQSYVFWLRNRLEFESAKDSKLPYLDELGDLALENNLLHFQLFHLYFKSVLFRNRGEFLSAFTQLDSLNSILTLNKSNIPARYINSWYYKYYHGRAISYALLNELDESLVNFEKCNSYIDEYTYRYDLIRSEMNISYTKHLMNRDDYQSHLDTAIKMCEEGYVPHICEWVAINKSRHYIETRNLEKTQELLDKVFSPAVVKNIKGQLKLSYHRINGSTYILKNEYDKGEKELLTALQMSKEGNTHTYTLMILQGISDLNVERGNYQKALEYEREIRKVSEQLKEINFQEKLTSLEFQKEKAEANEQISKLERDNHKSNGRRLLWFTGFLLMTGLLLAFVSTYFYRSLKLSKEKETLEKNIALSKLEALSINMNPHFIFNSFNTLQNYIINEDKDESISHLAQMSTLIRGVLKNSKSAGISLSDELELIESYVDLEKKRFEREVKFILDVEELLLDRNPVIPSMILQPHIENVFVHAFNAQSENPTLRLSISTIDGSESIRCVISDNGVGRDKSAQSIQLGHLGMATANTRQRLQLLDNIGYSEPRLEILDLKDENGASLGTEVILDIPILEAEMLE